ncbi:MAG: hypothetical protein Q8O67_21900 [Deltaproteobacteria bacterium]|nr:hypothetical protein [Deltaproteobacteria bacterium]
MHAPLIVLAALASVVSSGDVLPVEAALVQSAVVVELNVAGDVACRSAIDAKGQPCGRGRRYELKGLDRTQALRLVNAIAKEPRSGCASPPTHAVLFTTTKGPKSVDVSFACHAAGGRTMSRAVEKDLASLLRLSGLVHGLPIPR